MASLRRLLGFLIALVLVAFSLPALADSGDKFSAVMSPTSPPAQAGPITFTATIKNLAKFDYLKSYTITVPVGLTISGTPTASSGSVSVSGQVVSVSGTLVAYTKTTQLTIKATPASSLGCSSSVLAWVATAKGGLFVNNEVFTPDSSSVLQTTVTPLCYTLTYGAGSCASITGTSPQTVSAGGSGSAVSAVPQAHYHFVSWSDGSMANPRTDTGVNANVNVTASCTIDTFTLTYTAGANGTLTGTSPQTSVPYGGSGSPVTAQANALFSFASWSDGSTANPRTDNPVTGNINVTASFVANTLTITSAPTSAAVNVPFAVVVNTSPGSPTVSYISSCGATNAVPPTTSGNSTTFSLKIPTPGVCNFTFSATNYPSAPLSLTAFAVQADHCSQPDASSGVTGSTFDASATCGSGVGVNVSGFAAGFRSINKDLTCPALNFTLTNNICGPGPTQDASGKTIPTNAVSLVWDSFQRAAFTYTVTWKAEYVNPVTGFPFAQKTQYCAGPGTNPCDVLKPLKACLSPLVEFASIPAGEPACISEEDWVTVPQSECAGLDIPTGATSTPACIRATTVTTDSIDPPIIRP